MEVGKIKLKSIPSRFPSCDIPVVAACASASLIAALVRFRIVKKLVITGFFKFAFATGFPAVKDLCSTSSKIFPSPMVSGNIPQRSGS